MVPPQRLPPLVGTYAKACLKKYFFAMTYAEVEPYIRHWVEVTLVGETVPRFRGMLTWAGGTIAVFIEGAPPGTDGDCGEPLPPRMSVQISKIAEIIALADPPWLIESNKAEAIIRAQSFLGENLRRTDDSSSPP